MQYSGKGLCIPEGGITYDEKYDIVFSVMQGQQQLTVLEELAKVNTKLIVMVGNDMEGDKCEGYIKEHAVVL